MIVSKRSFLHFLASIAAAIALFCLAAPLQAKPFVFPDECADCHGPEPVYEIKGAKMQYLLSGHNLGFNNEGVHSWYSNGGGCQQCHTHEGFLEYLEMGKIVSDYVAWPSQSRLLHLS